jgi:hypothetical protein
MGSRGARTCSSWCDSEFPRDDPEGTSTIGFRSIAGWGPNSSSWSSDRRIPRRPAKDKGPDRGPPPPRPIRVLPATEDAPRLAEIAVWKRGIDFAGGVVRTRCDGSVTPTKASNPASTVMRDRRGPPPTSSPDRSRVARPPGASSGPFAFGLSHLSPRPHAPCRGSRITHPAGDRSTCFAQVRETKTGPALPVLRHRVERLSKSRLRIAFESRARGSANRPRERMAPRVSGPFPPRGPGKKMRPPLESPSSQTPNQATQLRVGARHRGSPRSVEST